MLYSTDIELCIHVLGNPCNRGETWELFLPFFKKIKYGPIFQIKTLKCLGPMEQLHEVINQLGKRVDISL